MAADEWRNCVDWLVGCQILPADHRSTKPDATAFDLAQALRDGVLLCHLLNTLKPGCIDMKDFSSRPQMSQFLCMKNIRAFLTTCTSTFGLAQGDLFKPNDLFDVKDFRKVLETLSKLSKTDIALRKFRGFQSYAAAIGRREPYYNDVQMQAIGFPPDSRPDEAEQVDDIYGNLQDLAIENDLEYQEDIYDPVYQEDEEKIYDDLLGKRKASVTTEQTLTKRDHCIKELLDTESNYKNALKMIVEHFIKPLHNVLQAADRDLVFAHIEQLYEVHKELNDKLSRSASQGHPRLADVFIQFKPKLLVYGDFCSNLPRAQEKIDKICENELLRLKIQECERRANDGKFRLRDLLHVPMQRVLKYHLLLRELIKNTDKCSNERDGLEQALEAMQDLSLYVNEVKRDYESLQVIDEIQNSINDLRMPANTSLKDYGRFQKDGELKVLSHADNRQRNRSESGRADKRHIFLFDKVMLMCKAKIVDKFFWGDTYSFKDAIALGEFKVDESAHTQERPKDKRDRGWNYPFLMVKQDRSTAYTFYTKTEEQRNKWKEAIAMALDNSNPPQGRNFIMYTFDKPRECDVCGKLLRGVFYQGYLCIDSQKAVHKECLGKPIQSVPSKPPARPPRNVIKVIAKQQYSRGSPQPPSSLKPALYFSKDDVIDVVSKSDDNWWLGRMHGEEGYFPKAFVTEKKPVPKMSFEEASTNLQQNGMKRMTGEAGAAVGSLSPNNTLKKKEVQSFPSQLWYEGITDLPNQFLSLATPLSDPRNTSYEPVPDPQINGRWPPSNKTAPSPSVRGQSSVGNLSPYPWYVGEMERETARKELDPLPDGTFLIRVTNNPSRHGELSLSIKYANAARHIKVNRREDGKFYLAETHYFGSVQELVDFYQTTQLADSFPEVCTTLKYPFKKVADGPRVLGYAVAIYDYAATSTSQVTLQVNDRIAILSKTGQDKGWWKGENLRTKRIGYFPLAYVQDEEE